MGLDRCGADARCSLAGVSLLPGLPLPRRRIQAKSSGHMAACRPGVRIGRSAGGCNEMPPAVAGLGDGLPGLARQRNPAGWLFAESLLTGWRRHYQNSLCQCLQTLPRMLICSPIRYDFTAGSSATM
jgi:hypothetical protein